MVLPHMLACITKKYKSLRDVAQSALEWLSQMTLFNQGRALLLLQQVKLIGLKDPNNHLSNLQNICQQS